MYALHCGSYVSVGRVQTPTLALIVERDTEIENFTVSDFFTLKCLVKNAQIESGRYNKEDEARKKLDELKDDRLTCISYEKQDKTYKAPKSMI